MMGSCAIVGAGASGLMAAAIAGAKTHAVTIFEKQDKIGRKITASGNGRCNISNRNISPERYHGAGKTFIEKIFGRFGTDETEKCFREWGIPFTETGEGRLFPASLQSSCVVDNFRYQLKKNGVELKLRKKIDSIIPSGGKFRIISAGREEFIFDSVILSAGGCAFPGLGGTESGYGLAASLGHTVTPLVPAILPLNIPLKKIHRLEGVKWDCGLKVRVGDSIVDASEGELLFTSYGISGPAALNVSRSVNMEKIKGGKPVIIADFFPDISMEALMNSADEIWKDYDKKITFSLHGIINSRIAELAVEMCGLDAGARVGDLRPSDRINLLRLLKGLELEAGQPRSFSEAVVTAGGVDTSEISPETMESLIHPGLFITGELLDIDGDSGGFNLQFAWSTGAIAGLSLKSG